MTFTTGKHRMRNGEEAEIIATNGREPYVLVGYIGRDETGNVDCWTKCGKWKSISTDHHYDLLPPAAPKLEPIEEQLSRWLCEGPFPTHKHVMLTTEARNELTKLREAIAWALGEHGTFCERPEGAGPYWWRKELRKRASEQVE